MDVLAVKDSDRQQPIPTAWRPVFCAIVAAFAKGDYLLGEGIREVTPLSPECAAAIERSIVGYGARLDELPEATWNSSVCMWYGGYWDTLVDLWTLEEGASDLTLCSRVTEQASRFSFAITGVYVP